MRTLTGPFGQYGHGTAGAVLNALCEIEGVPLSTVERVSIGKEEVIYDSRVIARYRWFEGLAQPLFSWCAPEFRDFRKHRLVASHTAPTKPQFRLTLCLHGNPALEVDGELATPALYSFLRGMLTNFMDDPRYKLNKAAGGFFQGGYGNENGGWFLIEFWKPEGAQAWVDFVNEHYDPAEEDGGSLNVGYASFRASKEKSDES